MAGAAAEDHGRSQPAVLSRRCRPRAGVPPPLSPRAGPVLIWSALALVAWGSLVLGKPFTAEYARSAVPQTVWNTPGFRRVNAMVAEVWGTVFVTNAAHAVIMVTLP